MIIKNRNSHSYDKFICQFDNSQFGTGCIREFLHRQDKIFIWNWAPGQWIRMQRKDSTVIRFLFIELRPWPLQLHLGKHFTKSQGVWLQIRLKSNSLYLIFWQFSYNKLLQKPWQHYICKMSFWFTEIWVISHQCLQCRNFECLKSSVICSFGGLCYLLSDGVPSGNTWWCHQMETCSELLALCAG